MAVQFPKLYYYIRRTETGFIGAKQGVPSESQPIPLMANIHPASSGDYQRLEATSAGRRMDGMLRCFTDLEVDLKVAGETRGYPGDLVVYRNKRYLVAGSTRYDALDSADTGHMRYLLIREVEHSENEITA